MKKYLFNLHLHLYTPEINLSIIYFLSFYVWVNENSRDGDDMVDIHTL